MQAPNLSATTSPKEIRKAEFVDSVISNRDVRILKDGAGNIILIYVFTDNNTLVITSSETTMKMVAEKLLGSKVK
jgi:tRNA(His) 5'-end guanylyltransferase